MAWSPNDPSLLLCSRLTGSVDMHSLHGLTTEPSSKAPAEVASAVSGDPFSFARSQPVATGPVMSPNTTVPPVWLGRRMGATFGFGGKLLTFSKVFSYLWCSYFVQKSVTMSQVVSQPDLISRSRSLNEALAGSDLTSFCRYISEIHGSALLFSSQEKAAVDVEDQEEWRMIAALFDHECRDKLVSLLGLSPAGLFCRLRDNKAEIKAAVKNALPDPAIEAENQAAAESLDEEQTAIDDFAAIAHSQIEVKKKEPESEKLQVSLSRVLF